MIDTDSEHMPEALMTERDVARLLKVKPCTVRNERYRKKIDYTPIGAQIRYSKRQVEEYLERQTVKACVDNNQNPVRSENIGLARSPDEKASKMLGAGHGMTQLLDKHAVSVLARQTFMRQPRSSLTGTCSTESQKAHIRMKY